MLSKPTSNQSAELQPSLGLDVRAVANLLLDLADERGMKIDNLGLQKLVYFAHGLSLIENRQPLVSGYFEAWRYGPVNPACYLAFKRAGRSPIDFRAQGQDIMTGRPRPLARPEGAVADLILRVLLHYGKLSSGQLVKLSHAKDSPWWYIANKARTSLVLGGRITDDVIRERFCNHMKWDGSGVSTGELDEDAPFDGR